MNRARAPRRRRSRQQARTATGTCPNSGKRRYPDPDPAYAAALRLSTRIGRPIRTYQCPDCDGWHLTRRPAWKDTP